MISDLERCERMIAEGEQWLLDVEHAQRRLPDIQTAAQIEQMKRTLEVARSLRAKLIEAATRDRGGANG